MDREVYIDFMTIECPKCYFNIKVMDVTFKGEGKISAYCGRCQQPIEFKIKVMSDA